MNNSSRKRCLDVAVDAKIIIDVEIIPDFSVAIDIKIGIRLLGVPVYDVEVIGLGLHLPTASGSGFQHNGVRCRIDNSFDAATGDDIDIGTFAAHTLTIERKRGDIIGPHFLCADRIIRNSQRIRRGRKR
jgi:hypothetical protein